jgi:hypothetical protein
MKIKSQRDFFSGLLLIFVGAAFAIGATGYNFGAAVRPGPGYFPFGLGIILALLGVIVFVTSFVRRCTDGDPIGAIPWRPLICVVGAIVFFAVGLPRLGFVIAFPLMIVLTSYASTEFTWKGALLTALVLTVASYLIFIFGLQLNIPVWPV